MARATRVVDGLPQHRRACRAGWHPAAAQPPDRRPARHRRRHPGRPAARLRRRGDRHQPRHRLPAGHRRPAAPARRDPRRATTSPPSRACWPTSPPRSELIEAGRAGRPGVPVRSPAPRAPTPRSASTWRCCGRRNAAGRVAGPRHRRRQRHVLRDRAGVGAQSGAHLGTGGEPVDQQTLEARAYAVARDAGAAAGQHRRRLHRSRVPLRRQADHPGRAGGPLLRQAARAADGRGRLLHQPRRGRPGRHGHPAHAARRRRARRSSSPCPAPTTSCSATRACPSTTRSTSAQVLGLRPAPEFEAWLQQLGMADDAGRVPADRRGALAAAPADGCRGG